MGNSICWRTFDDKIRLTNKEIEKLRNFICDLNGKDRSSLHYIVLEGDYVFISIIRLNDYALDKLEFMVHKYFFRDRELSHTSSIFTDRETCIGFFNSLISSHGSRAIEDPTHKSKIILMDAFCVVEETTGLLLEIKPILKPFHNAYEVRLALKTAMDRANWNRLSTIPLSKSEKLVFSKSIPDGMDFAVELSEMKICH